VTLHDWNQLFVAVAGAGAALLLAGWTDGLYLVGTSTLLIFVTATTNVWVLLVAILR
jgi:hypothetical protein